MTNYSTITVRPGYFFVRYSEKYGEHAGQVSSDIWSERLLLEEIARGEVNFINIAPYEVDIESGE